MKSLARLVNAGKNIAIGASLAGALAGCMSDEMNYIGKKMIREMSKIGVETTQAPVNQAPVVQIGVDFGDGLSGKVNYLLTATDPEGKTIANVYARFNGAGPIQMYPNGSAAQESIISGTNSVDLYADDDLGLRGTAQSSFVSPTEAEARAKIDEILAGRGWTSYAVQDVPICTGTPCNNFVNHVDYFLNLGARTFVINYTNLQNDNAAQESIDKITLDSNGIENYYFKGIPVDALNEKLNKIPQ